MNESDTLTDSQTYCLMIRMGLRLITRTRNITEKKQRDQIHFIKLLPQDVGIIQANYIGGVI